jgi:hypothetical protein
MSNSTHHVVHDQHMELYMSADTCMHETKKMLYIFATIMKRLHTYTCLEWAFVFMLLL